MKRHSVLNAQHATATCYRGCLGKWQWIEKESGIPLVISDQNGQIKVTTVFPAEIPRRHWIWMRPKTDIPIYGH
ncbi:DUF4186 family protein [uncultured Desulfosarcina sp.]|uniref:DUF4186 family protein n=1 Tax=uncultured Desulfosarcina sp. TaxID=218289 RepID=UPI003749B4BD